MNHEGSLLMIMIQRYPTPIHKRFLYLKEQVNENLHIQYQLSSHFEENLWKQENHNF